MDKYEFRVSMDEIDQLISERNFGEAAALADTIDWTRVKSSAILCKISDLYKINRRYEDSREMLEIAYEKHPTNKKIIYSLCELELKLDNYIHALQLYNAFINAAPKDPDRYLLQYKLYKKQDVNVYEQIAVLELFLQRDFRDRWAYELAELYRRAGDVERCARLCDEIIAYFGKGRFVVKALELKQSAARLTPQQEERLQLLKYGRKPAPPAETAGPGEEDGRKEPGNGKEQAENGDITGQDEAGKAGAKARDTSLEEPQEADLAAAPNGTENRTSITAAPGGTENRTSITAAPGGTENITESAAPNETENGTESAAPNGTENRTAYAAPNKTENRTEHIVLSGAEDPAAYFAPAVRKSVKNREDAAAPAGAAKAPGSERFPGEGEAESPLALESAGSEEKPQAEGEGQDADDGQAPEEYSDAIWRDAKKQLQDANMQEMIARGLRELDREEKPLPGEDGARKGAAAAREAVEESRDGQQAVLEQMKLGWEKIHRENEQQRLEEARRRVLERSAAARRQLYEGGFLSGLGVTGVVSAEPEGAAEEAADAASAQAPAEPAAGIWADNTGVSSTAAAGAIHLDGAQDASAGRAAAAQARPAKEAGDGAGATKSWKREDVERGLRRRR